LLVGVDEELLGDLRRCQPLGGEVVALVAQRADDLGGESVVEKLDDVLAPRAVARRHRAAFETVLGGLERALVEPQPLAAALCRRRRALGGGGIHLLEIALAPSSANSSTATKRTRKTTNRILAIPAAPAAMPVNPSIPATRAMTAKTMAHFSMRVSFGLQPLPAEPVWLT